MFLLKHFQRWHATIYWFVLIPKENNTATTNNCWVDILINILKINLYILHLILHLIITIGLYIRFYRGGRPPSPRDGRYAAAQDVSHQLWSWTGAARWRYTLQISENIWKMQIESNWRYWNDLKYMVQHYWRLRAGDVQIWVLEKLGQLWNPHQ